MRRHWTRSKGAGDQISELHIYKESKIWTLSLYPHSINTDAGVYLWNRGIEILIYQSHNFKLISHYLLEILGW